MPKRSQFQNLVLQQVLQEHVQQPTLVQPSLTLPIKHEELMPLPAQPSFSPMLASQIGTDIAEKRGDELLSFSSHMRSEMDTPPLSGLLPSPIVPAPHKKKYVLRGAAIALSALLILVIFLTWHSTTSTAASPTITQQAYSNLAPTPVLHPANNPTASANDGTAGTIQVYIVGAVKHPGVYTLPNGSRVYQLIQAAGGTQPNADLVSINLAAKLTDGQEIYVLSVGEIPPASNGGSVPGGSVSTPGTSGGLVNINTADETTMEKALHISATTAKKIIDYRTQHGAYTSVDELSLVVSKTIYNRIKNLVTV